MKRFIYAVVIALIVIPPTKAYSGLRLKAATLLAKPAVAEVKRYNRLRKSSKEYKKATYNLTVGDIYYLGRVDLPNVQEMVDIALQTSFEMHRKDLIKGIFEDEDKEKYSEMRVCLMNVDYNEIRNNLKTDIDNQNIDRNDRYITVFLIKAFEKCANYKFSNNELIHIKRAIEYTIEQDLRS